MKKTYMIPTLKVESAVLTSMIAVSIKGDSSTGLTDGGGSNGNAHAPQSAWDIWDEE